MIHPHAGLSIRFEVDGDISKVDGFGGRRPLRRQGVWELLMLPLGVQGRSPWKQNEFNVLTLPKIAFPREIFSLPEKKTVLLMINQLLFYVVIPNKFLSRWLVKK